MKGYETHRDTRLYVDSSPVGTQATLTQNYELEGEEVWRPVNHTSRAWTVAEAGYGQIERESNGVLTGMMMNKMYTMGAKVEVVTDHEPLVPIYNSAQKPKQLRVNSHRIKLLPFEYHLVYEPGSTTPCDYGSRHPEHHSFTEDKVREWCIDEGNDINVNRLIEENLPHALTTEMLQKATKKDHDLQLLISYLKKRDKVKCKETLPYYCNVFEELSEINQLVVRGSQIVIPKSLRADVIALAHEGHQCMDKTLKLLRETSWFPKMSKDVADFVSSCRGCNASTNRNTPVPLEPNLLPDGPWRNLHLDFKGPIDSNYYLHVVIDQYSKYPEVDIVSSTSFRKLRPILDRIFSTHGIPETVTSDNGPPYPGHEMERYAIEKGFALTPVSPEDPQCNGFAENFIKFLCKMVHASVIDGKDPRSELHNYLLQYRATPHGTTGVSPAEMLFGRKIHTKLPQIQLPSQDIKEEEIRKRHNDKKMKQKHYHDKRHQAKEKPVKVGDQVLIRQKKSTMKSPFDPDPYTVTDVCGNRVEMSRGDGSLRVRDKNQVKVLAQRPKELIPSWESQSQCKTADYSSFEIDGDISERNQQIEDASFEAAALEEQESAPVIEQHTEQDIMFDIDESEEERMNALLLTAMNRENPNPNIPEGRTTRSSGIQLEWNPIMNSKETLLQK